MKKIILTTIVTLLSTTTLLAGGPTNREVVAKKINEMKSEGYKCIESLNDSETGNSVLVCNNEDEKLTRLFKVIYTVTQTGSRCGPSITATEIVEN